MIQIELVDILYEDKKSFTMLFHLDELVDKSASFE